MSLATKVDAVLEPFFPRTVLKRVMLRNALNAARAYDGAMVGRRTSGWRRSGGSANAEVKSGLARLRNGSSELVRNNHQASNALKQLVANLIGDGIYVQVHHKNKSFAKKVQQDLNRFMKSRIDGRDDAYGVQRKAARAMIERGEAIIVWRAKDGVINARARVYEGDFLDHNKNQDYLPGGGKIIQGKEYDADGDVVAYWMFDEHPGDAGAYGQSKRWDATHIDHLYEELRPGQARGVPWFAPILLALRDSADFEDAVLMKKKVEACLALILETEDQDGTVDPMGKLTKPESSGAKAIESLSPGMIFRPRPGESAKTLTPTSSGDGVEFLKYKTAGMFAGLVPYHLVSGDVANANYSNLRAAMIMFWALLDDWQQNVIIPHMVEPMARRRIAYMHLRTGDNRYNDIEFSYALPKRRGPDPAKDAKAEQIEVRTGFKLFEQSLAERGMTLDEYVERRARELAALHAAGIVVETDPSQTTMSGSLQSQKGKTPDDDADDEAVAA